MSEQQRETERAQGVDLVLDAIKALCDAASAYTEPQFQHVCLDCIEYLCKRLCTPNIRTREESLSSRTQKDTG